MTRSSLLLATTALVGAVGLGAHGASAQSLNSCFAPAQIVEGGATIALPAPKNNDCVQGGGSSLAAPTYLATIPSYTANVNTKAGFSYNALGSGASQCSFILNRPNAFFNPAPSGTYGAGPDSNGNATVQPGIDFAMSDAALTQAQLDAYNNALVAGDATNCKAAVGGVQDAAATTYPSVDQRVNYGNLMQIPTFGTPIAIAFRSAKINTDGQLQFTDGQLCGIFSGLINDWSSPSLASSFVGLTQPTVATPITVVYRSDGSGTSFLFTQHLGAVCTASNSSFFNAGFPNAGKTSFAGTTTFASLFPGSVVPSAFRPEAQSPGVQAGITQPANILPAAASMFTIGYLSPDYTDIASTAQLAPAQSSALGNFTAVARAPAVAKVQNATSGAFYFPSVPATTTALGSIDDSTFNFANPLTLIPAIPKPADGYPIAGFTTMDISQCYHDKNVGSDIAGYVTNLYNDPTTAKQINNAGFVVVDNSLGFAGDILFNLFDPSQPNGVDNAAACAGKVGR